MLIIIIGSNGYWVIRINGGLMRPGTFVIKFTTQFNNHQLLSGTVIRVWQVDHVLKQFYSPQIGYWVSFDYVVLCKFGWIKRFFLSMLTSAAAQGNKESGGTASNTTSTQAQSGQRA